MRTFVIIAPLAVAATACVESNQASKSDLDLGGIYWAPADSGDIFVYKIVAIDDIGVHLRMYSNLFAEPPTEVDESELYVSEDDFRPGDQPGSEHTQVDWGWFITWETDLVQQSTVRDEELDGYRRWLTERSPAFNSP